MGVEAGDPGLSLGILLFHATHTKGSDGKWVPLEA